MRKIVTVILFFTLACLTLDVKAMGMHQKHSPAAMPQMTEEDMMQFQRELEQYVSTLSEEEQRQFYKDVEELSQIMSTMSEEELTQFMEKVIADEQAQLLQEPARPAVEVMQPVTPEEKPKPVEVKQPDKTEKTVVVVIESLNNAIERFLLKAQLIPELAGDLEDWIEQNKIKKWRDRLTWNQFKNAIDELQHRLKKLLDKDPKNTSLYRYLGYINESLQNKFRQLLRLLEEHETRVEAPAFGLGKITKNSRAAIQEILNGLGDAIYTGTLGEEIDKIFKEYGPREQELFKLEDEAHKRAQEATKQRPVATGTIQVGGHSTGYSTVAHSDHNGSYGGSHGGYYDGQPYDDYGTGFNQAYPYDTGSSPTGLDTPSRPSSRSSNNAQRQKDSSEPSPEKGAPRVSPQTTSKDTAKKSGASTDKKADQYMRIITGKLDEVHTLFAEHAKLKGFKEHIMGADAVDFDFTNVLATLTGAYNRAQDSARSLKLHLTALKQDKETISKYYLGELAQIAKTDKKSHEQFLKDIQDVLAHAADISETKRVAYFGAQEQGFVGPVRSGPVQTLYEAMNAFYKTAIPEEATKAALPGVQPVEASKKIPADDTPLPTPSVAPKAQPEKTPQQSPEKVHNEEEAKRVEEQKARAEAQRRARAELQEKAHLKQIIQDQEARIQAFNEVYTKMANTYRDDLYYPKLQIAYKALSDEIQQHTLEYKGALVSLDQASKYPDWELPEFAPGLTPVPDFIGPGY